MTDGLDISRRRLLAGLGTIGVASAGAGLGTSAYFSDREEFDSNQLTAGQLDMKVAATSWYSDWSEDEAEHISMADPDNAEFILPAPSGTPGARDIAFNVSDGQAALNDLNRNTVNGGVYGAGTLCGTDKDADGAVAVDIEDVKPGDWGIVGLRFALCDNPGYVWLYGDLVDASENGKTEPELDDPDEVVNGTNATGDPSGLSDDYVELLDAVQVAVFKDLFNRGVQQTSQMSLREFLNTAASGVGVPLDGDLSAEEGGGTGRNCFAVGSTAQDPNPGNQNDNETSDIFVVWWLPVDHANQVQTDSAKFNLGLYTEQCRHNDGSGQATVVSPGDDLQAAIDGAPSDARVILEAGTHTGTFTVDKPLHISGEGTGNTILDAAGGVNGIDVQSSDVSIGDLTVTNAEQGIDVNGTSGSRRSNVTLSNIVARGNSDRGIVVDFSDDVLLRDITAYDNGNDGVTLWYTNDSTLNQITAYDNDDNGIYIRGNDNELIDAVAYNNGDQGVDVSNETKSGQDVDGGVTLDQVLSHDNANGGIELENEEDDGDTATQSITNCHTYGNQLAGENQLAGLIFSGPDNDGMSPIFDHNDVETISGNNFEDGAVVENGTNIVDVDP